MKLHVIGFGQCGSKIADEFAALNRRARSQRGFDIATGAYAVNTDEADLSGLRTIPANYQHRIVIGTRKTGGHGVGKINEAAAEIAREDADKVIDAIRAARRFYESDAFLVIAATAGGTGSGSMPMMASVLRERFRDKPVYALAVLPFEHEERTEARCIQNTATCLKSISSVANAVILADNQRFVRKEASLRRNMTLINRQIAEPFYDFLCAGEEKKGRRIGARTLDAGDIIQSLEGWTTIGFGRSPLPLLRFPFFSTHDFHKKSKETHKGIQAMDEALSELSIDCSLKDAGKLCYLLAAPHRDMSLDIVKELGEYLKELAPQAIIRSGDYPRQTGSLNVTITVSKLSSVQRVKRFYDKLREALPQMKTRQEEEEARLAEIDDAKDIPSLL